MPKSDPQMIAESISSLLGAPSEEIKVGLSTVGHVKRINGRYVASARVADDLGQQEIDKHIGDYETYDEAADKVLQIRNMNLFALPEKK